MTSLACCVGFENRTWRIPKSLYTNLARQRVLQSNFCDKSILCSFVNVASSIYFFHLESRSYFFHPLTRLAGTDDLDNSQLNPSYPSTPKAQSS